MEVIAQSGSNRQYLREQLTDGSTQIRVRGTSREENHAFITMARHFKSLSLPVPEVYDVSDDEMVYTQQDLGDLILFDYLKPARESGKFTDEDKLILHRTMHALARIQTEGAVGLDWSVCYPVASMNRRSIFWDLNYFKYCYLKLTGIEFLEDALEDDFERLADRILAEPQDAFLYRDCQSRNVMLVNGANGLEPYFIDFQGGRRGPVYYDVASFLWQAKANYHQDLRNELIEIYLDELQKYMQIDREEFYETLRHFVLFRTLQVLGAYGFRGYFEKKPHFLQSIPFAIENLRQLLKSCSDDYPYLIEVLHNMTEMKQFKEISVRKPLVVRVYSFSYKKGIPADESGNGGGFVFDCRAVNNPGKYERYKYITGLEEPVIKFLENDGEIFPFLDAAYSLVDASVKRYIDRGFRNLMVSFGCTGGQHRSVYSAEKMAHHINDKYGVEVQLIHREQNIETTLPAKEVENK